MLRDNESPFKVYGTLLLMMLLAIHYVLYFRARPAIVNMMCEEAGDLWIADILDATYVLAWYQLNETSPYAASLVWRHLFVYLSFGSARHPSVQNYSDVLHGPPLPQ
jgi:hypothetical protein